MESRRDQTNGETVNDDLTKARLDRLAEKIEALPTERRELLMSHFRAEAKLVFSLKEAAGLLDCHPETLRRAIKKGTLKASKLAKDYRISKPDLEEYYRSQGGGKLFADKEGG